MQVNFSLCHPDNSLQKLFATKINLLAGEIPLQNAIDCLARQLPYTERFVAKTVSGMPIEFEVRSCSWEFHGGNF